jgi:tetratricopeptide (TPR) repeat protein
MQIRWSLGQVLLRMAEFRRAEATFQQMLTLARALGDRQAETVACHDLGNAAMELGEYPRAYEFYQQSLALDQDLQNRQGELRTRLALGCLLLHLADYEAALQHCLEALNLQQELDANALDMWVGYNNVAGLYECLGQYPHALAAGQEALRRLEPLDESDRKQFEGYTYDTLAKVHAYQGHYAEALSAAERALEATREAQDRLMEDEVRCNLSRWMTELGRYAEALDYAQEALTLAHELESQEREADALACLSAVYLETGLLGEAEARARQSLQIIEKVGNRHLAPRVHLLLGRIALQPGPSRCESGWASFAQALALAQESKNLREEAETRCYAALALHVQGRSQEALDFCQQALDLAQRLGTPRLEALASQHQAQIQADLSP